MRKIAYEVGSDPFVDAIIEYMTGVGYSLIDAKVGELGYANIPSFGRIYDPLPKDPTFCVEFSISDYSVKVYGWPAIKPEGCLPSPKGIEGIEAEPHNQDWPSIYIDNCDPGKGPKINSSGAKGNIVQSLGNAVEEGKTITTDSIRRIIDLLPELESILPTVLDYEDQFEADFNNLKKLMRVQPKENI